MLVRVLLGVAHLLVGFLLVYLSPSILPIVPGILIFGLGVLILLNRRTLARTLGLAESILSALAATFLSIVGVVSGVMASGEGVLLITLVEVAGPLIVVAWLGYLTYRHFREKKPPAPQDVVEETERRDQH